MVGQRTKDGGQRVIGQRTEDGGQRFGEPFALCRLSFVLNPLSSVLNSSNSQLQGSLMSARIAA